MSNDDHFRTLIEQVRAGNEQAAAELVRQYVPAIRRAVRMRLTDPRLNRILDSMDICQSVMASFFVRASEGQFDMDSPDQLIKLLVTMARNKLLDQARKQQATRRDQRRVEPANPEDLEALPGHGSSPSEVLLGKELLQRVRDELEEDERYLVDQRLLGREWPEIAAELGERPDTLRMRLTRAINRIARRLGLDEVSV
jgi:RNA polymerase sigma-70 factor (ECF subfamily)